MSCSDLLQYAVESELKENEATEAVYSSENAIVYLIYNKWREKERRGHIISQQHGSGSNVQLTVLEVVAL